MQMHIDFAFLKDRKALLRIVAVTMLSGLVGGLYGKFAPKWYRSAITLVPSKSQRSGGLSSALGVDLGALAGGLDSAAGASADATRIAAVLQSTPVSDAVIAKFDLKARYRAPMQEEAREALWGHCDVRTLPKPNLVQLSCEDRDPPFLQEMLAYFADYGNQVFRRVSVSSASEEVRFLEKRVADLRNGADLASRRMREFQETHRIVDLDSQAKAVVSAVAALNSQRISKQMELEYQQSFSTRDEAASRQLESQLEVVDNKLRDLEEPPTVAAPGKPGSSRSRKGASPGLFPAALAVPELRAQYEGLFRDRKVAEVALMFALERLEGAKASEARDVSTFQILDPPTIPERKFRPKGRQTGQVGLMLGFIAAVAFEFWRNRRNIARAARG